MPPRIPPDVAAVVDDVDETDQLVDAFRAWALEPVRYVQDVLAGTPDPWQCDVLDAIMEHENVAVRSCHGAGKTSLLAWVILWFTTTRPFAVVPTTAPTFSKQVKDVLWAQGVSKWWRVAEARSPWLTQFFELQTTRLQALPLAARSNARSGPLDWFAVGIASSQSLNIEGYHSEHLLSIFDEAKGIPRQTWESMAGMRTTQEAKLLVASTPGGQVGEFYKVFTQYRTTWKSLFVIRPAVLREKYSHAHPPERLYFSERVRPEWVRDRAQEWGEDSPVFVARVVGDFPSFEGDVLVPYTWLERAEDIEDGCDGPRVVACDVARHGRDRTVLIGAEGGSILCGETIARTPEESTAPEARTYGIGADPKHPLYRSVVVTAEACSRMRREIGAEYIVIDDTGLGGGVTDILRHAGENVIPINFGASPTDKPRTPEERETRKRKHLIESHFTNLKSQMGWALRSGFEQGLISLARLRHATEVDGTAVPTARTTFLEALIGQVSMVKQEFDAIGRIRIVDPDDVDEYAQAAGAIEGRKSPDHFHALLLCWWIAGREQPIITPVSGVPHTRKATLVPRALLVGSPSRTGQAGAMVSPRAGSIVGGQAARMNRYR